MEKAQFLDILSKYIEGRASKQEEQFLHSYYQFFMAETSVIELLENKEKERLKLAIKAGIDARLELAPYPVVKKVSLWPRFVAAAVLLLSTSLAIYFYTNRNQGEIIQHTKYTNDVAPGKQGATLLLASGKKIHISEAINGLLAMDPGVKITKSADGLISYQAIKDKSNTATAYNTLTTTKGETFRVQLPDNSIVYLNAASSLRYPTIFKNGERNVELSGEAYFEVAKNANRPFRVITEKQTVQVLGTHFNVNAYPAEEYARTTLLEGSVKILSDGNEALLRPGQQSAIANGASKPGIQINTVNTSEAVAWKDGWFQFENADIKTIMNQIGRWYNVEVIYQGKPPEDHYKGKVSRNVKVSQVLNILETSGINFKIEGKKIIVK
ncbi:DUF4974 domain-containing protein [Pedobacter hiemivivus]|uniref:DUF4974 domain-containing protein n=1 Tax=Pedobacter hiemivivus TaxID=2530454 RepID=A0A4U1GK26_9SPHI|nr:FecR family protein [Pedobacter hiemivivus]TKC63699.1 DUF4974 domain-containing protein [Pedobacter hiemivivus]